MVLNTFSSILVLICSYFTIGTAAEDTLNLLILNDLHLNPNYTASTPFEASNLEYKASLSSLAKEALLELLKTLGPYSV